MFKIRKSQPSAAPGCTQYLCSWLRLRSFDHDSATGCHSLSVLYPGRLPSEPAGTERAPAKSYVSQRQFAARVANAISLPVNRHGVRHDSVVANEEKTGSTGSTDQVQLRATLQLELQGAVAFNLDLRPANRCLGLLR